MASSIDVSVVIPVLNEENNLEELIKRCLNTCRTMNLSFEIILVDDGSTDGSSTIIISEADKNPGQLIGIILNRNYGQHSAIMAGFSKSRGKIIVTLDADLQNPPEEITRLVNKINEGFDVVGSIRVARADSFFRRISSWFVNKMAQKTTGELLHDYGCMLRAYRRHIVEAMLQCNERNTFIPILALNFAQKTTEIEVKHDPRKAGYSKYSLWKLINLQFDLLTSMSTFPLRLLMMLGIFISLIGFSLAVYILIMRAMMYGDNWSTRGIFTAFAIIYIFIGAQFIGMGLLGEYIGRMYYDVRSRPRFFIRQVVGRNEIEE